jgi:chitin disaccharide deacetylase
MKGQNARIRLAVKGDDMGAAHSFNVGTLFAHKNGIVRSTDLIVPGPWFLEAIKMLKDTPTLDAGVHLTLTSEWDLYKWRPLTPAKSLVDQDGYFYPFVFQNRNYPAGRSLLEAKFDLKEVEAELRAQIDMAKRHLPRVSFLSPHMGAVFSTPELRKLAESLAAEYRLPFYFQLPGVKDLRGWYKGTDDGETKALKVAEAIRKLEPGDYTIIDHAATDDPEARAIGHRGYERVARDRADVVKAWTDPGVLKAVAEKKVELVGIRQLIS